MLNKKLNKIKMLILDVDGVLTDGSIFYDDNGNEIKKFNVKDGLGIELLKKINIEVGIITGRNLTNALSIRLKNLKIKDEFIFSGVGLEKEESLGKILKTTKLKLNEIAYIGDDLPDIPILKKVGFSACPSDAMDIVKDIVDYICKNSGGNGAVREVCEMIINCATACGTIKNKTK